LVLLSLFYDHLGNPLITSYEGGDLLLAGAALAGGRATARSLCMQAVGGGLSSLAALMSLISDESALEMCTHVMRYTNRRLYLFQFTVDHNVM